MTVVTGNIQDIGMAPLSGSLEARSAEFRASGDVLIAPEARAFPVVAGAVEADLLPGPVRVTISVGSHARETFDVIVPESGPAALASLVEDAVEWSPQVVSRVAALRDEAVAARDVAVSAAESAAEDAQVVGSAAQDMSAQVSAAQGHAQAAAGSASSAASSAGAAAQFATDAEGSASDAAGAVVDARAARDAAEGHASSAAGSASSAAGSAAAADGHAGRAEAAANEFDLTATATTGAPGSNAAVTVTGDGPAYGLSFTVPRGDTGAKGDKGDRGDIGPKGDTGEQGIQGIQGVPGDTGPKGDTGDPGPKGDKGDKGDPGPKGDKGDDGEVSQAMLDAAVATLVDNAPEALNTLSELAQALGDDPNFATTISTQIGQRALIDGAPVEYDSLGKLVSALIAGELGGSTDGIAVGDPPEGESPTPTTAGVSGVAVGLGAQAGVASAAIGHAASAAVDISAAIGYAASAAGVASAAIGYAASADGDYSAAIGAQASADGMASVAIGMEASADGMDSAAIGYTASAAGERSAAIGALASAPDDWTIAIGAHPSSGMAHHVTIPGTLDVAGKTVSTDDHTHTPASLGAVARSGSAVTLWSGTQAQYDALAEATKTAAGFIAVITG